MKAVLVNGSHRTAGNTAVLLAVMGKELSARGARTETVSLARLDIGHCRACDRCRGKSACIVKDDFNALLRKILAADTLILGSPVYAGMPSSRMTAFLQRLAYLAINNGHLLKNKVGGAVVVAGEAGHLTALNSLIDFFLVNEMIVPGSRYWPVGTATDKGNVAKDVSALENIRHLAGNIAALGDDKQ
ncbi:MAG: flavodoxin family protein [Elusimicrobiales bacterium]